MDDGVIDGIDIQHIRLVELTRLADQAKPFYDWVEAMFQRTLANPNFLEAILLSATGEQIQWGMYACFTATSAPTLFDGVGRSYDHATACFYFFAWIIRDAPKQRLEPIIRRIMRVRSRPLMNVRIEVLSTLIVKYRHDVKYFSWVAIREVIIDRLEGSRRAIRGRERESIIRLAFITAIQSYFDLHKSYGIYTAVQISSTPPRISGQSIDIGVELWENQVVKRQILASIKTRETEGGGHAILFARDVLSAIRTIKAARPEDFLVLITVALNWSSHEAESVIGAADLVLHIPIAVDNLVAVPDRQQEALTAFVHGILEGSIAPKQGGA